MSVLYFDDAWDEDRLGWEVDRLRREIASIQAHIQRLEQAAAQKREDKLKRAQGSV
ncbi:hypothetical protein [Geomonas propionica]|uniref:Uncharacterized protein n=1 Tax=Geomonas propionica TaxID=2798582 RepID=A0ABS0YL04_9BACT|nr:hypothetical protein [Geomonas propionica]MBJ6798634.1 hypothetical protein [Geomonas propionica]